MEKASKKYRICQNGHHYYKISDCPTCPICERERKPENGLLSILSAPARRALQNEGIITAVDLSQYSLEYIKKLHGIGTNSILKLIEALEKNGLSFKV